MRRWEELAGKPGPLTDEEKAEAEAAIRALSGSTLGNIGKGAATLLGGDGYTEEDARRRNLAEQLKVRASAVPGFIVGMGDAIPFVGRAVEQGLDRTGQVPREAWATENYLPEGYNLMRDVPREHPAAYTVGSGVMDLTQILGMSGAIEGATGAIKGFSKLPRALQGAINSIGTFGTLGALREAGEGGSAADVAKAGLIQGAGAAVGSGMGSLVSGGMTRGLFRAGLQNSVAANILRDALAGSAFAGGDMAARALLDSEYRPTSEEAVKDLAVAFAFSAITSSLRSIRATGEAKARLERDVDAMKRDYASIVDGAGGQVTEQALDDLAARSARVRETMGRTQYVGQQATVDGIYEFLDTLDDSIARARASTGGGGASGGLPGASGGALAPVGGGSSPAGGFSTPSSGGGPTMAGAAGVRAFSGPLDGLGEHGQKAFSAVYDGQSNPAAFYAGFVRAYNAGKAGKPLAEQPVQGYNEGQENTLSEAQRFAAYSAGENDRKAGEGLTPQSATRTAPLVGEPEQAGGFQHGGQVPDGGGERGPGVGSGGQAGILAEGTGRDQGRDVQGRRAAQRRAESQALGGGGQSAAGLGIPGGTERESVRVIPEHLYDEELSGVAAEQAQAGRKVVFTVGALEVEGADGVVSTARGASYGDTLYIQADHERYTATQLADHESFHDRVRREPALRQRVADAVLEKYGGPELDGLLDYYVQVYAGVYGGEIGEAAFEELLADAYAGINVFAGADTLGEGAAKYTGTVRGATGKESIADKREGKVRYSVEGGEGGGIRDRKGRLGIRVSDSGGKVGSAAGGGGKLAGAGVEIGRSPGDSGEVPDADSEGRRVDPAIAEKLGGTAVKDEAGRPIAVYHFTPDMTFTSFSKGDTGFHFGTRAQAEKRRHDKKTRTGRFLRVYLNIQNPLSVHRDFGNWHADAVALNLWNLDILNDAEKDAVIGLRREGLGYDSPASVKLRELLEEKGYDGIVYPNDYEGEGTSYLALYPEQIMTTEIEDFLEGGSAPKLSRESDLEQQVERLARRNEALREQFRVSQGARTSRKGVTGLASTVLDEYSSGYDRGELEKRLLHLYDFIANGRDGSGNELSYGAAKTEAVGIARDILDGARVLDDELYRQYKDLRDFLRGSKLVLNPADRGDLDMAGGYEAFKKANFGRFTLGAAGTPVDTVYRELAGRWPEFFPEDITHPADQLMQMADTLDGLQPVYENPYNYNLNEAAEELADDLLERFFEVPQEPPTFADKAQRRLTEQKIHDDKKLERLRSEKNARIAQERAEGRERVRQAVQRERERREKKVSALKTHYAEVNQRRRARAGESKARSRLLNVARRLDRMKTTPQNRAVVQGLIGDLDLVSKGITGQTVENLRALRDWYEGLSDQESDHYDPDFLPDPAVERALSRLEKKHIAEMDMEAVRELTETLLSIEHELRTERKLLASEEKRDIYHLAGEAIGDIRASGGKRAGTPVDAYNTLSLSPLREFRRLVGYREESPFYCLAVGLNDGQRRMLDFQMRASKLFDELVRDGVEMQRFTGKKAEEIEVTGLGRSGIVTVPITPAMRVALCLHARNPANLRHIQRGGVTIPDMKLYRQGKIREAYAKGETVKLSPSSVRSIVAGMTEKERAFANKADRFFNGMCKEAINGTSLVLNGYEKATVEHYFPIKTDPDFTRVDFEALVRDGTLEGAGFLKGRIEGAANPILLEDVTQVLRRQIDNVSRYYGLAVPVRNFNKVWNATMKGYADSVKKALGQVWGPSATKYIENLMTDLQNGRQTDQSRLDRLRGNFAQAVLAVNVSVTMKQAASYPTAAGVLGWRPLVRAFADGGRVNRDLVAKYTPLLWFREQGGSTTELGDVARRQGWADKLPGLMGWIQKADVLTVAKLWKASGYYVREHNKALQVGSEAYYREVAEVFNRVVEETQPNYTVMQRPDVLRTPNQGLRALTMFSTQRMQNYNMLYDAVGEWRAREERYAHAPGEETRKARDEARKKLARNISAQLVAAATIAAMTLLSSVLLGRMRKYKNEEGEVTLESALAGLGEDFVGTLMGSALFGSDVYNAVMAVFGNKDWYDIENPSVTLINDMVTAAKSFWTAVEAVKDGEADAKKLWLKFNDLAVAVSKFAGVPLENMEKMAGGVGQFISRLIYGPLLGEYYYLAVSSDTSVSYVKGELYDLLFRAKNQDQKAYREMYEDMVGRGFKPESIKSAMDSRLKDSADFTRRQGEVEDKITEALEASRGYRQLPEAYREGALEDAAAYAAVTAKGELSDYEIPKTYAWVEKADGGKAVGLEPWEYILYRAALDMYNEGPVSITQDEAEAAIESLPGLNDEERAYLWQSTNKGWKEESNPWG